MNSKNFVTVESLFHFFVGHRSAEIEHPIRFSISGTSKFSEARKVTGKTRRRSLLTKERKSSYEGPYHVVRKMALVFSLTETGEQQIGWVLGKYQATMGAVGKACHRPLQKRERTGKEYDCFPFV